MSKEKWFRTQYDKGIQEFKAPTGDKYEMRHNPELDQWGKRTLVKDRKVEIYDIIQSHKDECDFNLIIRRAIEGDVNALNIMEGHYIDITDAPRTLMESQNMMLKAQKEFEELPQDVRQKFDYDYHNYLGMMFDDPKEFAKITGLSEKWEKEKAVAEETAKWEQTTHKAIENLANMSGTMLDNGEKGVNEDA